MAKYVTKLTCRHCHECRLLKAAMETELRRDGLETVVVYSCRMINACGYLDAIESLTKDGAVG